MDTPQRSWVSWLEILAFNCVGQLKEDDESLVENLYAKTVTEQLGNLKNIVQPIFFKILTNFFFIKRSTGRTDQDFFLNNYFGHQLIYRSAYKKMKIFIPSPLVDNCFKKMFEE